MTRWILAVAILLGGGIGLASADYVIIIANLGQPKDQPNQFPGMPFPPGGGVGAIGGGFPGGNFQGTGMIGTPGGARGGFGVGGMGGMFPPGGNIGGPGARGGQPFPGGNIGGQPFPGGNIGGRPGPGNIGGGPGNIGGGPGNIGGGPGNIGGGPGNIGGGTILGQPGQPGQPGGPDDISNVDLDAIPYLVKVVVEVNDRSKSDKQRLDFGVPIKVKHKWGESLVVNVRGAPILATFLPYPPVSKRYEQEYARVFKDGKPTTEQVLELADWALRHGRLDKFTALMDKLAQDDKTHPAVVAYVKVKEELARDVKKDDAAVTLRAKLAEGYKTTQSKYYTVLHNSPTANVIEVKSHLDRLDDNLRAFYYWFALHRVALPVPQERLVVLVLDKEGDFTSYHDLLTSGPVVADGFFARRENLTVLSAHRRDEPYQALTTSTSKLWAQDGYNRDGLLSGKAGVGYPRGTPQEMVAPVSTYALLLKAMEADSELASISHDASRQLVYGAGLLPRNVAAPEWILHGMGSFFETPLGAPWPTTGAASGEHLPIFRHLQKTKSLEKTAYDTLYQVVTDGYFRRAALAGEKHTGLRKARATSWALTYFLAEKKLDNLQRYYKELGKMPRDIELDDEVLFSCFAKAFDALDRDQKPDRQKLTDLANKWYDFMQTTTLEEEEILNKIKENLNELKTLPKTDTGPRPPGIPGLPGGPGGPGGGEGR
jgi:hypothetical protein